MYQAKTDFNRIRKSITLTALFLMILIVSVGVTTAADAPHWSSTTLDIGCTSKCHSNHNIPEAGDVNLCQSCHIATGMASDLPILSADKASNSIRGRSHGFDVDPVHSAFQTLAPQNSSMALRLEDGKIVCSTCHNPHSAEKSFGGTPKISQPNKTTGGGSPVILSKGIYTGDFGKWYLINIVTAGNQNNAEFKYSNDNGISWSPGTYTAGTNVDIGFGVFLEFPSGTFELDEKYEFYASWPFLRIPMDSGVITSGNDFCRDCHRSWVMTHDTDLVAGGGVESYDGNYKSHPVGVALNANSEDYDRTVPLDADGLPQGSSSDTNTSNDLVLDSSNLIQCTTCHSMHYADSITETEDLP